MPTSNVRTQRPEWIKAADDKTGRELWQITSAEAVSEAVYFEAQAFTADERYLVFRSERDGASYPYRCDLQTGELLRLSDGEPVKHYSMSLHPDGRHLYWVAGEAVWRVDVTDPGEPERVFVHAGQFPGKLAGFALLFTLDGRYTALATTEPDRDVPIPDGFSQQTGHPSHLLRLDLETGEAEHVLTWDWGFSHPMVYPADPDRITFVPNGAHCWNMDLPQERRTRTMVADVGTGEARPLLTPLRQRTITHENWSPDGERLFFFDKNAGEWVPVSVCSVDRDGGDWQCHYTSYEQFLGHGRVSPDGRYFVSDAQKAHDSPLILVDLATSRGEILCWPDTSQAGGHPKAAHCHPSFSPRGNYITFTSDKTGTPQVYVLPLQ
ncbi:MAG: oligogalacturonate lyase family protein [Phycisphaeraceae bacterium]